MHLTNILLSAFVIQRIFGDFGFWSCLTTSTSLHFLSLFRILKSFYLIPTMSGPVSQVKSPAACFLFSCWSLSVFPSLLPFCEMVSSGVASTVYSGHLWNKLKLFLPWHELPIFSRALAFSPAWSLVRGIHFSLTLPMLICKRGYPWSALVPLPWAPIAHVVASSALAINLK